MKRFLLFAMAALAMLSLSGCGDTDPEIEGTWLMRANEHHYFDATFKAGGDYEWKWMGVSGTRIDEGTYTFVNGVVTMTPATFKEEDYNNPGKLISVSSAIFGWSGPRTIKVTPITEGAALWEWENDWMIQSTKELGYPVLVLREDFTQNVSEALMKGTWERYDSEGKLEARVIVKGKDYTFYSATDIAGKLVVAKTVGTWSHKGVILTLTPTTLQYSYEYNGVNYTFYTVDPVTLESETWISAQYDPDPMTMAVCVFDGKIYTAWEGTYIKK